MPPDPAILALARALGRRAARAAVSQDAGDLGQPRPVVRGPDLPLEKPRSKSDAAKSQTGVRPSRR